jgi:hypothetical protein
MSTFKYNITHLCRLELDIYDVLPNSLALIYTERASDGWYLDRETYVDIDEKTAKEMVNFLIKGYPNIIEKLK